MECGAWNRGLWSMVAGIEVAAVKFKFFSFRCQSFYVFFFWMSKFNFFLLGCQSFNFFFIFFPCNSSLFILSFHICLACPLIWWMFRMIECQRRMLDRAFASGINILITLLVGFLTFSNLFIHIISWFSKLQKNW